MLISDFAFFREASPDGETVAAIDAPSVAAAQAARVRFLANPDQYAKDNGFIMGWAGDINKLRQCALDVLIKAGLVAPGMSATNAKLYWTDSLQVPWDKAYAGCMEARKQEFAVGVYNAAYAQAELRRKAETDAALALAVAVEDAFKAYFNSMGAEREAKAPLTAADNEILSIQGNIPTIYGPRVPELVERLKALLLGRVSLVAAPIMAAAETAYRFEVHKALKAGAPPPTEADRKAILDAAQVEAAQRVEAAKIYAATILDGLEGKVAAMRAGAEARHAADVASAEALAAAKAAGDAALAQQLAIQRTELLQAQALENRLAVNQASAAASEVKQMETQILTDISVNPSPGAASGGAGLATPLLIGAALLAKFLL